MTVNREGYIVTLCPKIIDPSVILLLFIINQAETWDIYCTYSYPVNHSPGFQHLSTTVTTLQNREHRHPWFCFLISIVLYRVYINPHIPSIQGRLGCLAGPMARSYMYVCKSN